MKASAQTIWKRPWGHWKYIGAAGVVALALAGCGGGGGGEPVPDTPVPPPPPPVASAVVTPTAEATALAAPISGEACATCHSGASSIARSGPGHQASYDQLYQNAVIKITNLAFAQSTTTAAGDTSALTFKMTKNGAAFDCTQADTVGSYWAAYDAASKTFPSDLSLAGTRAYNAATGVCTITKKFIAAADIATLTAIAANADGIIALYGADEVLETVPAKHMQKAKYPFAAVLRQGPAMGAPAAPFESRANVSGCENCHTQPFNKHAYIPGAVDDNTPGAAAATTQQFYVCKGCHYDQRNGGHQFWQLLQEAKLADPATAEGAALRARAVAVDGGAAVTDAEKAKYAYKAKLMNDVHMSHAMEFAYPQSMKNCVTCHEGKMDESTGIFRPANFTAETCISCHSVNGIIAKMKAAPYPHSTLVTDVSTLKSTNCMGCHGAFAPTFKTIHDGGYDPKIYSATGVRYATTILAKIDSATYDSATNVLDVKFSAAGTVGSYKASDIKPTVIVGLYGYDTRDFIVAAHGTAADGKRNLEHVWGDGNPRFTDVSGANGAWEVKVDLSLWKDMIGTGKAVKRLEVAVLPQIDHAVLKTVDRSGKAVPDVLGLDAPSRTFDLVQNRFDDAHNASIVNVKRTTIADPGTGGNRTVGCNTCHDQLATTFHSGIRGGNITVCRLCHEKSNSGFHLQLQSRSIDSYVHSIHAFQAFDMKDINWSDPFEAMEYRHHTSTEFPRFGLGQAPTDCESCHVPGKYGVPDQSKSLPALLSASDTLKGIANPVGSYPAYVTGPAANACGSCHRSEKIIEADAGGLSTQWSHWKQNGYLLENVSTLWNAAVAKVMAPFK